MIKLVPQIFIKQSLNARPVLSAEEYSRGLDGNGCKKHSESAQRRLLPVLSSLTHGFPVEVFQALMMGRHGQWAEGEGVENSGGRSPPSKGPLSAGSEPSARNKAWGCFRSAWGPLIPFSLLTVQ